MLEKRELLRNIPLKKTRWNNKLREKGLKDYAYWKNESDGAIMMLKTGLLKKEEIKEPDLYPLQIGIISKTDMN